MTDEGEEADLVNGRRKKSTRERFRNRLVKKSEKLKTKEAERDEDLKNFLGSSQESDVLPRFPSPSRKPVPRISVSTSPRWPGANDVTTVGGSHDVDGQDGVVPPKLSPKRKKRKNLTVRFAETAPRIIGEGGDEAEAPTIWISQMKKSDPPNKPGQGVPLEMVGGPVDSMSQSTVQARNATEENSGETFNPRVLVRAPTGLTDTESRQDSPITPKKMQDAEFELTIGASNEAQSSVHSRSDLISSSSAGLKRKMLEEEARAFTSRFRDPSPEPPSQQQDTTPRNSSENLSASSSPPSVERGVPMNTSSDRLSLQQHSPTPSRLSSSSSHVSTAARSSAEYSRVPKRKPLPKPPEPESKEDALTEFKSHARRYYGLFTIAVERTEPGLNAPLSRWIRAAGWWFLMAELNFKLLRRNLEEGVNILLITASRRHMQAVVDLSKTAWIVEDMVYEYARAHSIDISTPESIEKLIQSSPLSRFGCTLQYWQDVSKRFRSLVAAVRRNGFMTSRSEDLPLSAGIDTSIWLPYPIADARTLNWFSSANPAWFTMDDTVNPVEPLDLGSIVPLKSTANTFLIKSIFCQTSGGYQNENRTPNMPCLLTIGRRPGSYALVLLFASQDHSINVVIETDPVRGDGVDWQQKNTSIIFNFADGFQLLIQLQKADYIYLKENYDLARRACIATIRNTVPNAASSERMIFRATSKSFERKSTERITGFPPQGEQTGCEVLLFEKYEAPKDMSTSHRAHRGYRLSIMLSPHAASLGILDVNIGVGRPILVHSSHEYNPPRVELMDSLHGLLMIQFSRNQHFNAFYEALTSLDHSINEDQSQENVPLRSFLIEPTSGQTRKFLEEAPWRNVQVTLGKERNNQLDHSTSTETRVSINICVFSNHAIFADRLPQGMCASFMVLVT